VLEFKNWEYNMEIFLEIWNVSIYISDMVSSGMLRSVALVRTHVSEELSASFIRVTKIGELGTTLAVTSNRRTLRRNTGISSQRAPVVPSSQILEEWCLLGCYAV
jgi:hypothetical protein